MDAYLGILAGLEEWSYADKSDLIVPHDDVCTVIWVARYYEGVLKDCHGC